ncbi:MAG TPA: O-antigen ligase family protein [Terriglobales bacterium]|nr:O-antigen ligase family protein [Terriglobales bacterium]
MRIPTVFAIAAGILAAGACASMGRSGPFLAAAAICALMGVGANFGTNGVRAVVLTCLLLVPDIPSGRNLGLLVHWSAGLTLSNFIIPALALPMIAGAWMAGARLWSKPWPGFAVWSLVLLGWCLLTLAVPLIGGQIQALQAATLLAHLLKLGMFLLFGVLLAAPDPDWRRIAERLLIIGIVVNDAVGLAQAAGWLSAFSPLAQADAGAGTRASGLFYDANMYGVLCAWALLWLLTCKQGGREWRAFLGRGVLIAATAANLLASDSRAGFAALATGALVLLFLGHRRVMLQVLVLTLLAAVLFPQRSWQRVSAAFTTLGELASSPRAANAHTDVATAERLASMGQALRQIASHPLLGLGFGRSLYLGVPQIDAGPVRPALQGDFQGAQNMGLTVLTETGPIGLLLLGLALAASVRRLLPLASQAPGAAAFLAGFLGLLVACLTIEALWNARVLALVVMLTAGSVALARPAPILLEAAAA